MGEVLYSDIHGYKQKLEGDQLEGDQLERGRCCNSIPLLDKTVIVVFIVPNEKFAFWLI